MLIRFSSIATGPITMFGSDALLLIKLLGASDALPGAISEEDIPAALQGLRQQLELHAAANATPTKKVEEGDDPHLEPPIELASRAIPLIEILERAAAAKAPVMWEQV
jgi:hypothetical protein